jgi:hypothetical protein
LPHVGCPSRNVTANKVRVHGFKVGGPKDAASQDATAEAGREALELVFDPLQHVEI